MYNQGMERTIELQHKDLTEDIIGEYIEISCTDLDDEPFVLAGLVDDFETEATDDGDTAFIYIHARDDDGRVHCFSIGLDDLGLAEDLVIRKYPDFAVTYADLDQILRDGGHRA